jgi:peptidoglycan/LPS O-acetylase OafA/YrhL
MAPQLLVKPSDWVYTKKFLLAALIEGHTAVSLFLVISGFILTLGTLDSPLRSAVFFRNRALRILPMLLVLMLIGSYMTGHIDLIAFLQMLSPLGGGANLFLPWTALVWSISVEAQLYFLFPYVHQQLRKDNVRTLLMIVALTYLLRLAGLGLNADLKNLTYWTTLGHVEQFLAGAYAAWWMRNHATYGRGTKLAAVVVPLAIVTILYGFYRAGGFDCNRWWRIFFPSVEAAMWSAFVVVYVRMAHLLPRIVGEGLRRIGKISYSVYLLHMTVITIFSNRHWYLNVPGWVTASILLSTTLIYLPLTLIGSSLTFTLVEMPFLELRKKYVNPNPKPLAAGLSYASST